MPNEQDGRKDFDFFIGRWKAHSRRLRERLKGSHDWDELEGAAVSRKVPGGLGNLDEITIERDGGRLEGLTLRIYNPEARQWSLYWASDADGVLKPPMTGGFSDGRGEFYSPGAVRRQAYLRRFICSDITDTSCRWEQPSPRTAARPGRPIGSRTLPDLNKRSNSWKEMSA